MVSTAPWLVTAAALAATSCLGHAHTSGRPMNGWSPVALEMLPPTHKLTVKLRRNTPHLLKETIDAVSNPDSHSFRQYLSRDDVKAIVRPVEGAYDAVATWARGAVPTCRLTPSPHGDYLFIEAAPDALESLFPQSGVDFVPFGHADSKHTIVGAKDHVEDVLSLIPSHVLFAVDAVFGLNDFHPVPERNKWAGKYEVAFPGDKITPTLLRSRYNITEVGGQSNTQQGIAAFEDAEFRQADVNEFLARYKFKNVQLEVLGPNDGGYYGEAGLDTQYIMTGGEGIKTWFLSQEVFDLLQWSFLVMNMTVPPQVLSLSWGSGESSYRPDHMSSANEEFMKMGLQGISIFTASGDDGCGKRSFFKCYDPTWPTTSPYITSVGGTQLMGTKEQAWKYSGGGFSAVFDRPAYQDAAVNAYLRNPAVPSADKFSAKGRCTPDISAPATNYLVDSFNTQGLLSGTSASTPVVAGMVALVNELRARDGKPSVGFINPTLYAAHATEGNSFLGFDITEGDNGSGKCKGFPAVPGYDAVTGFGSPVFDRLFKILNQK